MHNIDLARRWNVTRRQASKIKDLPENERPLALERAKEYNANHNRGDPPNFPKPIGEPTNTQCGRKRNRQKRKSGSSSGDGNSDN